MTTQDGAPRGFAQSSPGEAVADSPRVRILFDPGDGDSPDILLAFAGVSHRIAGIEQPEFVRSINSQANRRDVVYVIDKTTSWYNESGPEILAALLPLTAGRRVHTLGNSMGGFGAILFSRLLPQCVSALAFAPQYSIDQAIAPFETRWAKHLAGITEWRYRTCLPAGELSAGPSPIIFCGAESADDISQAQAILRAASGACSVFVIEACDHRVARRLRSQGALAKIIEAALAGRANQAEIVDILSRFGIAHSVRPRPETSVRVDHRVTLGEYGIRRHILRC